MENRETLFARVSVTNQLALTEAAIKLNRTKNEIVEEILNAWRLKRDFKLSKKESNNPVLDRHRNKADELRSKAEELRTKRKVRRD